MNRPERLPPVDCPLLIELPDGSRVRAERTRHVAARGLGMEYRLSDGSLIIGAFPWTYP